MLLAFLYHHVHKKGKYSNCYKYFEKHLSFIKEHYPIVLPGDPIHPFKIQVCLTFDDAYYDFYHFVFPLLKKYQTKCLLAVPIDLIIDKATLSSDTRLKNPHNSFCTWDEILDLSQSGLVKIASHSFSHKNLTQPDIDLEKEIVLSKKTIEEKLQKTVDSFVYPFGKFNSSVHQLVKKHYPYIFRIGSTFNLSWKNLNQVIYRINGDNLNSVDHLTKKTRYPMHLVRYLLNSARKR